MIGIHCGEIETYWNILIIMHTDAPRTHTLTHDIHTHTHSISIGPAGTFCVLSSVLEQLKVEGIVDLFFTIHSLRQQQPGLVQTFVS